MPVEQVERHDVDQLRLVLEGREHVRGEAGPDITLARYPLSDVASGVEQVGAGGQVPEAVVDQATVG